ncbi:uncharacterized protein LOC130716248 [Lotus japonicus]|uniref:uncharacterized protein LOC130716248 n=1 Tax=Lotus japonicus TaxID=34305 RepID=UPI00258A5F7B|nr:uncharacterized protein LOC130716248 [Lotus japonicus]
MGMQHLHGGSRVALNSEAVLVIKVPDAQVLRIVSRSLFLALVFATLPFLGSFLNGSVVSEFAAKSGSSINVEVLGLILHDLGEEGLLRKEDKALILNTPRGFKGGVALLNWDNEVNVVMDESYDFVITPSFEDAVFADSVLKVNGIVAFPLSDNASGSGFRKQSHYKVVYLRRYGEIFVALRKIGLANKNLVDSSPKRKLCQFTTETKEAALKGLEGPLLEPPREAVDNSNKNLKIKYLPELLDDSLEGYKRRVFIGVGLREENKAAVEWFERNYPKKGTKFQIHSLLVAPEEDLPVPHSADFSDWLSKHVKEEEYVVMKAEAAVVEEMMKKRTIYLVDELFLECNNEWWQTGKQKKSRRAYWECLALYGRLRDEGVAVHQWWG